ncbi:class I SAM-dependent methyltransferase [Streptomyces sp. NPDC051561]|uniref:class I SAM-dependent methyltransferase n=1 Tax=Streptomyces sp. NPDC051561 TaxID=3365658 RepID=UPI0037BD7DBE
MGNEQQQDNQQEDRHGHGHDAGAGHGHGHGSGSGSGHGAHAGQGHAHGHDHSAAPDPAAEAALAELLELDAEVLGAYLSELMGWLGELTADAPPRRIADLGSGTGTGTRALLRQFEGAEAVALDMSETMLDRFTEKAREAGIADQVRAVRANLDEGWPQGEGLDSFDLIWASASLHHMADPDRSLAEILAALRPGGLLVAAEMNTELPFPRFLPRDLGPGLGRPGLEDRCHAVVQERHTVDVPHLGDDWAARLTRAGFKVEAVREFAIDLKDPLPAATGRYARATLRRLREGLSDSLEADDLAALDALVEDGGPHEISKRDDLTVQTSRTVYVARRA